MRKTILNFVIDLVSLLAMLALAATGLLMRFVLPPGTGGRGGGVRSTLWSWTRHDWGDLHTWLAITIGTLLLVHVALHWNWVCCVAQRMIRGRSSPTRTWAQSLYGLGVLGTTAAVILGFVWFASTQVVNTRTDGPRGPAHSITRQQLSAAEPQGEESPALPSESSAGPGHGSGFRGSEESDESREEGIRGSMTLAEVAAASGVSAEQIRSDLKLPESVSLNERIGRLRRQYGFEISQLREVVQIRQSRASSMDAGKITAGDPDVNR